MAYKEQWSPKAFAETSLACIIVGKRFQKRIEMKVLYSLESQTPKTLL